MGVSKITYKKFVISIELKSKKKDENNNQNKGPENGDNKKNEDKKDNEQKEDKKEEKKEENEEGKENENNKDKKSNNENNNNENKENEQINIFLDSNRRITNNDVKESSTLIIEEKECNIFNGEKITINALGMVGGRGVGDGVTIFGRNTQLEDSGNSNVGLGIIKPDFVLNLKEKYAYPYIFMIYYEKDSKSYFIRPYSSKNNDNRILYIKLKNGYNLPLKQKEIISAGNIIFQVSPIENYNLEIVNLSKQSLSMIPKQTFDASSKKEVTIGRNKDCDFSFPNNKSFSRIQTTFEFDEENQEWIIIDGSRTKSSTNGTWVFCNHSFPIKDKMIVEVLNNRIQINEENKGD